MENCDDYCFLYYPYLYNRLKWEMSKGEGKKFFPHLRHSIGTKSIRLWTFFPTFFIIQLFFYLDLWFWQNMNSILLLFSLKNSSNSHRYSRISYFFKKKKKCIKKIISNWRRLIFFLPCDPSMMVAWPNIIAG